MSQHFHYMKPLASKNVEKVQRDYERYQQKPSSKFKIEDIREMSYTLPTNYSFTIYRLYLTAVDSGELSDVGWVINDRNSFCLLCFKDFGVRRWKHHCRACGSLVCKECSNFESELISFESLGPQKVCQSCYKPNGGAALRISRKEGTSLVLTEAPPQPAAEEKAEETQADSIDETFYNQTIEVIPLPGYVVKTRRDDDSKVFINIYHHDSVKDEFLLLLRSIENNTNVKPEDTMMIPTVYLGEKKATIDKNGAQSTLYTIVISSKYFEIENEKKSTNPLLIQKIIDVINLNYQDHLIAEEYVRPKIKVGFQGLPIINPEPFVLNRHLVSMVLRIQDDETRSAGRRPSALDDDTASRRSSAQPTGSVTANAASRPNSNRSGNARTLTALTRNDSSLSNHGADNASEISDMTQSVATDASSTVGGSNMLSVSQYFYATSNIPDGRSLLTSEMLRHTKELSITSKESSHLVEESTRKPSILIGWQIMLFGENENLNGVFVITGTRKNHLRKTEYRISNLIHEDQWIKLRRNEQKTGIEFRPLRKVLSTI